jgi:hypothetical protein
MKVRSLPWILSYLGLVLCLSACFTGIEGGVLEPESGEEIELEGEEIELNEPDPRSPQEAAQEGNAQIDYYYSIKSDILSFELKPVIGLTINPEADGVTYTITGVGLYRVEFMMLAGGGPEGQCRTWCTVDLQYVADGTVEPDPDLHSCKMPIRFTFTPNTENWEMTTECPPEAEPLLDCAALSMVMMDPSIYTFTRDDRSPTIPSEGATLYATMTNLTLPSGLQGMCDW